MSQLSARERQALIWDYYKPRHTHAWNMLIISGNELNKSNKNHQSGFEIEYLWENFILRLWLYRTTVKTLTKLISVKSQAEDMLKGFDQVFDADGRNSLKAVRDMIEHFDDYAAAQGRGPAIRERDLDPWRMISQDQYERGRFVIERQKSYDAAVEMHSNAKRISDDFIEWYKSTE